MIINAAKAREAAEVLGVELDSLTPSALTRAYHAKAKDCHPDHHGANELALWSRVSWSKEVLTRWLKSRPIEPASTQVANAGDCRACGGTGRIDVRRGFRPLTIMCVMCSGSGELNPEQNKETRGD